MPNIYYQEKILSFGTVAVFADERLRRNTNRRTPLANVARFRLDAGTIETIDIWTDFPIDSVDAVQQFTAKLNGADLFPDPDDRPDLAGGDHASVVGLAIDVDDGDILSIDLTAVSGTGVNAPLYFRIGMKSNAAALLNMADVDGSAITDGDGLFYDAGSGLFLPGAGGGGGSGVGIFSPDVPYSSPDTMDDEFNGGVLDGRWAADIAAPTENWDIPSQLGLVSTAAGGSGVCGLKQNTSNADGTWRCKFIPCRDGSAVNFGFSVKSSAGANYRTTFTYGCSNGQFDWGEWVFATGIFTLHPNIGQISQVDAEAIYIELQYISATKTTKFRASTDGVNFKELISTTTLSSGNMDFIGLFINNVNGAQPVRVEWFRKLQGNYTGAVI